MKQILRSIEPTMTSNEIAELTNKRHDHVLRDIRELNKSYEKLHLPKIGFILKIRYLGLGRTRKAPFYELTKMQTFDLLTGYSRELRIIVNRRWAELEEKTTHHTPPPIVYNGVKCIDYIGWLLQNNYSLMSGQVRARIRKYPEQFRKTSYGRWYMSEAIAEYFLSFRANKAKELPSVNPNQLAFDY